MMAWLIVLGTNKINNVSLSCFEDKIFVKNNGCDELALGYYSNLKGKLS